MAPAYDIVAVKLLIPEDPDELALNLNGKKRRIRRNDFNEAMDKAHMPERAIENLWGRIEKGMRDWPELIRNSFLDKQTKTILLHLINERTGQVGLRFL